MTVAGHHVPVWYDEATGPTNGQGVFWNASTQRWESADVDISALDTAGLATDAALATGLATKQDTIPPGTFVDTTTDQAVAGKKRFLSDAFFSSGRPFVDAGSPVFGARNGAGQVLAASVRAAVAVAEAAGSGVFFSPGEYLMDTFASGTSIFVPLTKGLPYFAHPGTATILIDPTVLAWRTVVGVEAHSTIDLTGLHIDGLTFDGQSDLNPSTTVNAGQTRYMVSAYKGQNIKVTNNWFKDCSGRNIVSIVGVFAGNVLSDVTVSDNLFTNIGTPGMWHDHSTVYADGNRVTHENNTYIGCTHSDATLSTAYNAYEIHGQSIQSNRNTTVNYLATGLLVSARVGEIGGKPQTLIARDNIGYNVGSGIGIYPVNDVTVSCSDVSVTGNDITIAPDQWPYDSVSTGDPITSYPGISGHIGFHANFASIPTSRWTLSRNKVRWLTQVATPRAGDNFLRWVRPQRLAKLDKGHVIEENEATNCPASFIRVEQVNSLDGWKINRNTLRNVGKAGLGRANQALVSIGRQEWITTRPTGLIGIECNGNTIVDDQGTHTVLAVFQVDDPVAKEVSATTNGTTTITMVGDLHDLGSLVTHPDVPGGAYLAGISAFSDAPLNFAVSAFTLSVAATGSSTATATVTSRPPTMSDCEMLDNDLRVDDGSTVPLAHLQASESVYIRGRSRFVAVGGSGSADAGSTIVDKTSGLRYRQTSAPTGNSWATETLPVDVQVFNAGTSTWTKPPGAKTVLVQVQAAGGGGGAGRRGAAGTVRRGGDSGPAGGYSEYRFLAADLGATVNVTVGAGGTAGAAATADDTNGGAGGAGGSTYFGPAASTSLVSALSGGGGAGGTATTGVAVGGGSGMYVGGTGTASSATGAVGSTGAIGYSAGGGTGGGITTADAASAGGNGGTPLNRRASGATGGGAIGAPGATPADNANTAGGGGGGSGGGSSITGVAGDGGSGINGGGGGGGGASLNGNNSGAGGAGGAGRIVVTTMF